MHMKKFGSNGMKKVVENLIVSLYSFEEGYSVFNTDPESAGGII